MYIKLRLEPQKFYFWGLGEAVKLVFQLTQHSPLRPRSKDRRALGRGGDEELMNVLVEYFCCGSVHKNENILNYPLRARAPVRARSASKKIFRYLR